MYSFITRPAAIITLALSTTALVADANSTQAWPAGCAGRRVLVVVADSVDMPVEHQRQIATKAADKLKAMNVVLLEIIGGEATFEDKLLTKEQIELIEGLAKPSAGFGVALVGQDGVVAARSNFPMSADVIGEHVRDMPAREQKAATRPND